jgi:hypothetical protein
MATGFFGGAGGGGCCYRYELDISKICRPGLWYSFVQGQGLSFSWLHATVQSAAGYVWHTGAACVVMFNAT